MPEGVTRRSGLSILIIEDNIDSAETLAAILRIHGYRVRIAHNGPSALQLADAVIPDVCLIDIGLSGIDGCELVREIKFRYSERWPLLVAITGYGRVEDVDRSMAC